MSVQLLQGNCLELMKNIPDGSVDMVLADLPYGTMENAGAGTDREVLKSCGWDKPLDHKALFDEYTRATLKRLVSAFLRRRRRLNARTNLDGDS